ncbi:MAG: toprim domain-containing protein [Ruminococcus sp.]
MIKINEAIIVEGKYDKSKLASLVDAVIIVTNGFGIFKDREKLELIRYYARKTGIIIMTDSDSAGQKIRGYIKGAVHDGRIINVYIPDVFGKEKRKEKPSAEGKLGVEGISSNQIAEAFERAGITSTERTFKSDITPLTLYELGLSGGENSRELRKRLQKSLDLPELMSASSLTEVLNTMMTAKELAERVAALKGDSNGI